MATKPVFIPFTLHSYSPFEHEDHVVLLPSTQIKSIKEDPASKERSVTITLLSGDKYFTKEPIADIQARINSY